MFPDEISLIEGHSSRQDVRVSLFWLKPFLMVASDLTMLPTKIINMTKINNA